MYAYLTFCYCHWRMFFYVYLRVRWLLLVTIEEQLYLKGSGRSHFSRSWNFSSSNFGQSQKLIMESGKKEMGSYLAGEKNLEWSLKPIIYLTNFLTGVQLNSSQKPEKRCTNRFFTLFSTLWMAFNTAHTAYYIYLVLYDLTGSHYVHRDDVRPEASASAAMTSKCITLLDHILFIFGTKLAFYVVSLFKLQNVWISFLKLEQYMALSSHIYDKIRNAVIVGLVFLFLVRIFNNVVYRNAL